VLLQQASNSFANMGVVIDDKDNRPSTDLVSRFATMP
jgi:hypothetical protein